MNVLVTGATGFIGFHLVKEIVERHQVFALTRHEATDSLGNITWIKADLQQADIESVLPGNIDVIIHLAQSRGYRAFPDTASDIFKVNIQSIMTLLEYARIHNVRHFIFTSSANVYQRSNKAIDETGNVQPETFYANSKRIAEMLLECYSQYFLCTVLRLFTVYGTGQTGALIPTLIDRVRNDLPVQIIGGKVGLRISPIYVSDIASVIGKILQTNLDGLPNYSIFNCGGNEITSIFDLTETIGKVLDKRPKYEFVDGPNQSGWVADSSKLFEKIGVRPIVSIEEGIRRIIYGG